jgi:DNA-binding NarL/FixJ family response regulator
VLRAAATGGPAFGEGLAERALDAAAAGDAATPRLTERESEVLRLVVEGLTARQIATRLVLSPRTVENHIQRTLRKFDVPGRAALVRYAIEHGLA